MKSEFSIYLVWESKIIEFSKVSFGIANGEMMVGTHSMVMAITGRVVHIFALIASGAWLRVGCTASRKLLAKAR